MRAILDPDYGLWGLNTSKRSFDEMFRSSKRDLTFEEREVAGLSDWLSPALFGTAIAGGAAWLSYAKLKLDLFDKRYAIYKEVGTQTMARLKEINATNPPDMPDDKALRAFWTAGQQVDFLFGPHANEAYLTLEKALSEYLFAWTEMRFANSAQERAKASPRFTAAHSIVLPALAAFHEACSPALRQYNPHWYRLKAKAQSVYAALRKRLSNLSAKAAARLKR